MNVIADKLISWFNASQRDLPWRLYKNPYHTWVSEIMLQQTQVKTVIPYFHRFIERFPDYKSLAAASLEEMLIYWQGLGYYKRAENLHKAARYLVQKQLPIPQTYEKWLELPGIGDYIASAICAIAYDQKIAVVDGNVLRVLSRLFIMDYNIAEPKNRRYFKAVLETILPEKNNRFFSQAMMELGALVCRSQNPDCDICPLAEHCQAFHRQQTTLYPISIKTVKQQVFTKYFYLIKVIGHFYLEKRHEKGLLSNLWQFIELKPEELPAYLKKHHLLIRNKRSLMSFSHQFTHQKWIVNAELIHCDVNASHHRTLLQFRNHPKKVRSFNLKQGSYYKLYPLSQITLLPVHKSMQKMMEQIKS
ncbi:MAG TPA: A/G-specific adenine glycosylase [Candidatus Cloacimonadota bacterium]|nr:A/G-specific adenine glycosylase [Candidatus Cloacimonadota bacterium]